MSTLINEDMQSTVEQYGITDTMLKRGIKLGNADGGHSNYLKGIIVQADFHAAQYWWLQAQRYHWFDIVSSQSKMHKILEMDLDSMNVHSEIIEINKIAVEFYKDKRITFEELLDELPMGFEYTAGVSTNYLCLKNMYLQRQHHRLVMWNKIFVEFCEGLPYFKELCLGRLPEATEGGK
jgi:hypothetical protein